MRYGVIFLSKLDAEKLREINDFVRRQATKVIGDFYYITSIDDKTIAILGFIVETEMRLDEIKEEVEKFINEKKIKAIIFSPFEFAPDREFERIERIISETP